MIYRIELGFSGAGSGWAETHAMLNASNNPIDLYPTWLDIAQKRVQMLGREFTLVGIRIARYSTDAGVRQRGSFFRRVKLKNSVTTVAADAEPSSVALIVRGSAQVGQVATAFDANQNQIFLGAPLDVSVNAAGEVDEGKGGLGAAFGQWRTAMLNTTVGWLANETIADVGIKAITQKLNGTVSIETLDAMPVAVVPGKKYKCRCRQINQGTSPLNRELIYRVVDATHLESVRVVGVPTAQTNGFIRVYRDVQPFIDLGDLALSQTVGRHKRGRPYGSSPGRRRKQILG